MRVHLFNRTIETTGTQWIVARGTTGLAITDCVYLSIALESVEARELETGNDVVLYIPFRDGYDFVPPALTLERRGIIPQAPYNSDTARVRMCSYALSGVYPSTAMLVVGLQNEDGSVTVHSQLPYIPSSWRASDPGNERAILVDYHLAMLPFIPSGLQSALPEVSIREEEAAIVREALTGMGFQSRVRFSGLDGALLECTVGGRPVRLLRPDLRYSVMAVLIAVAANRVAIYRRYTPIGIIEYPELASHREIVIRTALACRNMRWIFISQYMPPAWAEIPVEEWSDD